MKKSLIIKIGIIVILLAIIIILICMINNKEENDKIKSVNEENKSSMCIAPDAFRAIIVSAEDNKITVVSAEEAAISQISRLVVVSINDNTQILQNGEIKDKTVLEKDKEVTISFDGKIISTLPLIINAEKIEL